MPRTLRRAILERHRQSLQGRLRSCRLESSRLGIGKPYYVYEPPAIDTLRHLPILYLFRGHEREWVYFHEDASRKATTAIEDLDRLISMNLLPPVLAVLPGLNSTDNYVPSLGINMLRTDVPHGIGLGSGRFGDYLTEELFPKIEADYPQVQGGIRLGAGFSLGGYTISMLAARLPGYFQHMGIYDGLFMWPHHEDPRHKPVRPFNDRVWLEAGIFDAAFGKPRDREALTTWNPADAIQQASRDLLHRLRETTWWISCAAGDGNRGNRDRATFFADLLAEKGIPLGFESVHFHKEAAHSWHWNDRFLIRYLKHVLK